MSRGNRGIHRHSTVDGPGFVGSSQQPSQHDIPGAFGAHPSVPGPDRLPRSEYLGHVSPGDPTPVPVDDPFDNLTSISKGSALLASSRWQKLFDQYPLSIGEQLKP